MSPSSSTFSLSPSSSSSSPISWSPINIQPEENFHHLVKPFLCVSSFKILEICGSNVFPNCKILCNILVFYAEYFICCQCIYMWSKLKCPNWSRNYLAERGEVVSLPFEFVACVNLRCHHLKTITLYSTNGMSTGFYCSLLLLLEFTFPMDISSWSIHSTILHTRVL